VIIDLGRFTIHGSVNLDGGRPTEELATETSHPGFAVVHHVQTLHGKKEQTYRQFGQMPDMEPTNEKKTISCMPIRFGFIVDFISPGTGDIYTTYPPISTPL